MTERERSSFLFYLPTWSTRKKRLRCSAVEVNFVGDGGATTMKPNFEVCNFCVKNNVFVPLVLCRVSPLPFP